MLRGASRALAVLAGSMRRPGALAPIRALSRDVPCAPIRAEISLGLDEIGWRRPCGRIGGDRSHQVIKGNAPRMPAPGALKRRSLHVRAGEIGIIQCGRAEIRVPEIGLREICAGEICPMQIRAAQAGSSEFGIPQIRSELVSL